MFCNGATMLDIPEYIGLCMSTLLEKYPKDTNGIFTIKTITSKIIALKILNLYPQKSIIKKILIQGI